MPNGFGRAVIGRISAPWAKDVDGKKLRTKYDIEGNTIVQSVEATGAKFPIVGDPKYTWGIITGTVYYNRAETRSMKTLTAAAVAAAGICAVFGPATLGAACGLSAVVYGQWTYVAGNAYSDGKCIKIKIPLFWAYAYGPGGYCT